MQIQNVSLKRLEEGLPQLPQDQEHGCCDKVFTSVKSVFKEVDDLYNSLNGWYHAHTNRLVRNLVRVSLAGGISMIGSGMAGDPRVKAFFHLSTIPMVWFAASVSGFANGLSTGTVIETDGDVQLIEARRALTLIEARVIYLEQQIIKETREVSTESARSVQIDTVAARSL